VFELSYCLFGRFGGACDRKASSAQVISLIQLNFSVIEIQFYDFSFAIFHVFNLERIFLIITCIILVLGSICCNFVEPRYQFIMLVFNTIYCQWNRIKVCKPKQERRKRF
jgi:hypothetical protein